MCGVFDEEEEEEYGVDNVLFGPVWINESKDMIIKLY